MRKQGRYDCGFAALLTLVCCAAANAQGGLEPGHFEVRAAGGINGGAERWGHSGEPSWGIGFGYGLSRRVALTAGYTHDELQSANVFALACGVPIKIPVFRPDGGTDCGGNLYVVDRALHEFMGGVRFSAVNRSRITPFARLDLGIANRTTHSSPSGFSDGRANGVVFAFSPGAGLDLKLTRHFGVSTEAAFVKPHRYGGFYRVMGGVYYRF